MVYFTERYLPLFFQVSWGGWDRGQDAQRYIDAYRKLAARKQPYVALSEARWASLPDATGRKELAEMSDTVLPMTKDLGVATAAVLGSKLQVGAAMAVSWLMRSKHETLYVTSAVEGLERLREAGKRRGLVLPVEVEAACRRVDQLAAAGQRPPLEAIQALL